MISLLLFATAIVNLFTKQLATISGVAFSALPVWCVHVSERLNKKTASGQHHELEQFRVNASEELTAAEMEVRPGNILVAVRDPKNLSYLRDILLKTDTIKQDVVVMTARVIHREHSFSGNESMDYGGYLRTVRAGTLHRGGQPGRERGQARFAAGCSNQRRLRGHRGHRPAAGLLA